MKLIEKMAKDHCSCGWCLPDGDSTEEEVCSRYDYEAGFRAALKMAASLHSDEGYGECPVDFWALYNIGEDEDSND